MEKISITEEQCEEIIDENSDEFELIVDELNPDRHRWTTYYTFIAKRKSDGKFFMGRWGVGNTESQDNDYPEQELEECEEIEKTVKTWVVKKELLK